MKTSKFRLDTILQNETATKILSVLLAVIIWFVVALGMKTDIPREIKEVPVKIDNQSSFISRMGLTIIGDEDIFVDVTVEGQRLVVGGIKAEDLSVSVDLSSVNGAGSFSLPLIAENTSGKVFNISSISPQTVQLKFDRMVTKRFGVTLEMEELIAPETGYLMEEPIVNPMEVSVTGPDTDIALIDRCVVRVRSDNNLTKTTVFKQDIVFLDKDGNELSSRGLTIDASQVEVTIPVLKTVELPVKVEFINQPENVSVEDLSYEISNETITVAGPADEIEKYTEILLGYIDFKKLELNSSFNFDVDLPDGFTNVGHIETVTVNFDWTDFAVTEFSVTNLSLLNRPAGYNTRLLTNRIGRVIVIGPKEVLESMTAGDLIAQIDLSGRTVQSGQFKTAVNILAPTKENVWVVGDYTVVVEITEQE